MSQPIIKVEHLSKQYKLGVDRTYQTFQDAITTAVKSPLSYFKKSKNDDSTFWALKDVSFEVEEGAVMGIIGRNGAGKSTLLKLISRITEPTEGKITLRGRVSSLLEVGTGFHPELSGRENIYLNGSIMGMTKRELNSKFDDIVKFAEIEKFLDTPVKRYSSGMYIRLAFAVAAHLEPEILIVDEVLAVGDAAFQKKCTKKMGEVAKGGETVLFVSHNMSTISHLCDRTILLNEGSIVANGKTSDIIELYQQSLSLTIDNNNADRCYPDDPNKSAIINRISIFNSAKKLSSRHDILEPIEIKMEFCLRCDFPSLLIQCEIFRSDRSCGFGTIDSDWNNYINKDSMMDVFPRKAGVYEATIKFPAPLLNVGIYEIEIYLTTILARLDTQKGILVEIVDNGSFSSFSRKSNRGGFLAVPVMWDICYLEK